MSVPVSAYQPAAVVHVPNVAALTATGSNFSNTVGITLDGYYVAGDGGGGLFTLKTCTPDHGLCFADGTGHTYLRSSPNGNLKAWGITTGSPFDANAFPTSVSGATNRINEAFTNLAAIGISNLTTDQVSVYLGSQLNFGVNSVLECGSTSGAPKTGGNYVGQTGTIFLNAAANLHFQVATDGSSVRNCLVLPIWIQNPAEAVSDCSFTTDTGTTTGVSFTSPPATYADLEAIRTNMIVCSSDGIFDESSSGGVWDNLWVLGFDNPLHIQQGDHTTWQNIYMDGNVCVYTDRGGGQTDMNHADCGDYLTKQVHAGGGSGAQIYDEDWWQISNITASTATNSYGRHMCELTLTVGTYNTAPRLTPPPFSDIPTNNSTYIRTPQGLPVNYPMWVTNLNDAGGSPTGAASCLGNGPWAISYVSSTGSPVTAVTIDLLGSDFGHGAGDLITATATWAVAPTTCPNSALVTCSVLKISSGNVNSIQIGEVVADDGAHGIPVGSKVVAICQSCKGPDPYDGYIAEVYIDHLVTISQGLDTAITFDSGAFVASGTQCNGFQNNGYCAFFHASERTTSGNSPAAQAVGKVQASNQGHYGAGWMNAGSNGLRLCTTFSFGHHYGYVIQDANSASFCAENGDENGELDDLGQRFFVLAGSDNGVSILGNKNGQSGTSITNDIYRISDATDPSNKSTTTGSVGTGLTSFTTVASWSPGRYTFGICQTAGTGTTPCEGSGASTEEFFSAETNGTTITPLARGQRFTSPASYTSGATVVIANITRFLGCASFDGTSGPVTNPSLNSVELVGGCLMLTNTRMPGGRNAIFADNATVGILTGTYFPSTTFFYEDAQAYSALSGCGNVLLTQQTWNCPTFTPQGIPVLTGAVGTGVAFSTTSSAAAGRFTVGTSPSGSIITMTFPVAWANPPMCFAQNETSGSLSDVTSATTTVIVIGFMVTPAASDKISYTCVGF